MRAPVRESRSGGSTAHEEGRRLSELEAGEHRGREHKVEPQLALRLQLKLDEQAGLVAALRRRHVGHTPLAARPRARPARAAWLRSRRWLRWAGWQRTIRRRFRSMRPPSFKCSRTLTCMCVARRWTRLTLPPFAHPVGEHRKTWMTLLGAIDARLVLALAVYLVPARPYRPPTPLTPFSAPSHLFRTPPAPYYCSDRPVPRLLSR